MKVQLLVLLVLGALIPIACDPLQVDDGLICVNRLAPESGLEDYYWGQMSALRNGELWIVGPQLGTLYAHSNDDRETMNIYMGAFEGRPSHKYEYACPFEDLVFQGIPRRLGTYPLPGRIEEWDVEQRASFGTTYKCDVSGLSYVLDKSEGGFISIDAYDRSSCTIEGTFALTVIRKGLGGVYPYVDTLRFTEGRFHTHVVTL